MITFEINKKKYKCEYTIDENIIKYSYSVDDILQTDISLTISEEIKNVINTDSSVLGLHFHNLIIAGTKSESTSYTDLYFKSKKFGEMLKDTFLIDNWTSPISINAEQSVNLLNKFEVIIKLCNLGDIKNVKVLLENTEIDEIFTQERKDKYLEQIKNHLK